MNGWVLNRWNQTSPTLTCRHGGKLSELGFTTHPPCEGTWCHCPEKVKKSNEKDATRVRSNWVRRGVGERARTVNESRERKQKNDKGEWTKKGGWRGIPKGQRRNSKGRERNQRAKEIEEKGRSWAKTLKMASPQLREVAYTLARITDSHLSACAGEMWFLDFPNAKAQLIGKQSHQQLPHEEPRFRWSGFW